MTKREERLIELMKENFEIDLSEFANSLDCGESVEDIEINGITKYVNKEEYELLKEMLENE